MLIGNCEAFAIEILPVQPSWELRYPPEAAAWAGLAVWVGGKNLCAHVRRGEAQVRSALFVPLGPIADWFVRAFPGLSFEERVPWVDSSRRLHDVVRKWGEQVPATGLDEDTWLDRREEFWARHFLVAGAEGAWLPNLGLLREDDDLEVVWCPPHIVAGPSLTFLQPQGEHRLRWSDFEAVCSAFVEEVANAFSAKGAAPYPWLAAASPRLHAHTGSSERAIELFCARSLQDVASLLEVSDADVVQHLAVRNEPASSSVCQILRDLPPRPTSGIGAEVRATLGAVQADAAFHAKWRQAREVAIDAARAGASAEEAGQLAARALRAEMKNEKAPLAAAEDVLGVHGVRARRSAFTAKHEQMLVAATPGRAPVATLLATDQTTMTWGARFELSRALGHAVLDLLRGDALGAASTKWAQDHRRRRSGAFAAELILPKRALEEASGGHLDSDETWAAFPDLLRDYDVGARTAAFQLYNHRLVTKAMRDELIAEHAR